MNEHSLDILEAKADLAPGFTVREYSGHTIIMAIGEIDAYSAPALTATIREQIRGGHHRLIVDLTGVPFMDSSGLGALVGGYKRTKAHADGQFALIGADKRFLDALRITGLVRVLPVYETLGQVLQARNGQAQTWKLDHVARHSHKPVTTSESHKSLACDRSTLLHLAEVGDMDALAERSLLYGAS